jgi:hypothetical protein
MKGKEDAAAMVVISEDIGEPNGAKQALRFMAIVKVSDQVQRVGNHQQSRCNNEKYYSPIHFVPRIRSGKSRTIRLGSPSSP